MLISVTTLCLFVPYTVHRTGSLKFIAESDGTTLPCVRTYENDLARLTLVGAVSFDQSLMAAAADGSRAVTEHVEAGVPAMVIETVYPGPTSKRATVSTRLFLPARKVKEKAQKLKKSFSEDVLAGTSSKNILAMTFRQVVMQKLLSFELVLFPPGTERDMEDLDNPREVPLDTDGFSSLVMHLLLAGFDIVHSPVIRRKGYLCAW